MRKLKSTARNVFESGNCMCEPEMEKMREGEVDGVRKENECASGETSPACRRRARMEQSLSGAGCSLCSTKVLGPCRFDRPGGIIAELQKQDQGHQMPRCKPGCQGDLDDSSVLILVFSGVVSG